MCAHLIRARFKTRTHPVLMQEWNKHDPEQVTFLCGLRTFSFYCESCDSQNDAHLTSSYLSPNSSLVSVDCS